jgi:hypothetical protein
MLSITSHGLHWRNNLFNKTDENSLLNDEDTKLLEKAKGIYVLEYNFIPIYIGKAEISILKRLEKHNKNHHKGRWDMFSWFVVQETDDKVILKDNLENMESLCITIMEPRLNGQTKFKKLGIRMYQK